MIVRAIHAYNPVNNDELKLCKNDLITVTQKDEGGWWEGTLNGKTGWFPSNYCVVEVDDLNSLEIISNGNSTTPSLVSLEINNPQRNEYRRMIVSEWIESENAHIMELQGMWDNYLQPLRTSDILKTAEYEILIGSMAEVLQFHTNMLLLIKKEQTKPPNDQRIGKIFLDNGSKMEIIHKQYCSNHPKAVQIIDKHTDALKEFMESKGAQKPGVLVLVVCLSQPFRRLEKYPCMLQELERHIEESHKDRGDLQRSIEFYKQIDKSCSVLRKQKEMELEVLNGTITGWEGTDVANLGEILYMNLVHVGFDLQPRYFVLFANTLLILTYATDTNSLSYEGKLPVSGILLTDVPDKDNIVNAFEIAGPMLEPILVRCSSKVVKELWLEHLTRILKLNRFPSLYYSPQQSLGRLTPPVQAWNIARLRPSPPFNPFLTECLKISSKSKSLSNNSKVTDNGSSAQSMSSLQQYHANFSSSPRVITNEEDLTVLSIVDAFCAKTRQISAVSVPSTVSNVNVRPPQSCKTDKLPRTLTDLVILLGEEVRDLKSAIVTVSKQLEEEQSSRKALQNLIMTNAKSCGCMHSKPCLN